FRIKTREARYMLLKRNESILWKLEAIEGYTSLPLERYISFDIIPTRRYELLNVKYLINVDTIKNQIGIVENKKYLPRAFFCYDYRVVKNDSAILNLLSQDTFDVSRSVILEEEPDVSLGQNGNAVVNIQHLRSDYLSVAVKTDQPGFLVLSEVFYPEWKARIDGNPTKIYRADYTLRAVYVPSGEHTIEMYYSKRNIKIGALITLITLIFAITIGLISYKKEKRLPS
ncbi:MAG: YfhO family protein, partial [candidate division WOR-3 bacterium]|nr:YfhO family protein [candidate division WOR-3 bacterium]